MLYYYDSEGYQLDNKVGAIGATTIEPLPAPEDKINKYNGTNWVISDDFRASSLARRTGTVRLDDDTLSQLESIDVNTGLEQPLTLDQLKNNDITIIDKTSWVSETITGRIRDNTKDLVFSYGDGTTETLYFSSNDEYAGKSERS